MDLATIIGITIGFGGIIGGMLLEGGNMSQIVQPTAAMIVLGGTWGATLVSFPMKVLKESLKAALLTFKNPKSDPEFVISEMVRFAKRARREGIIALEEELDKVNDPFLKNGLSLAIDGIEPQTARDTLSLDLSYREEHFKELPKMWEAAGGYSPTIGIIGAVMGLIQVMQNLENISEVGKGIAVAFVATIYGLITANILYLPIAAKLKSRFRSEMVIKELMLEGVCGLLEGMNPKVLENRLRSFFAHEMGQAAGEEKKEKKAA